MKSRQNSSTKIKQQESSTEVVHIETPTHNLLTGEGYIHMDKIVGRPTIRRLTIDGETRIPRIGHLNATKVTEGVQTGQTEVPTTSRGEESINPSNSAINPSSSTVNPSNSTSTLSSTFNPICRATNPSRSSRTSNRNSQTPSNPQR